MSYNIFTKFWVLFWYTLSGLIFFWAGAHHTEQDLSLLRGALIIFRHGNRAPRISYPNDPHKDYPWPGGYGFLTEIGIRQMYDSGVKFKKRYRALIPANQIFKNSTMQIRSSASPRCLMSAQSFMAGFLPPPADWTLFINWQPVLIESVPLFQDSSISQQKRCPKYENTTRDKYNLSNKEIKEFLGPKYHLLDDFSEHVGMRITRIDQIAMIADTLTVQKHRGLQIPTWAANIYNDTLIPLLLLTNHYTFTSELYRIKGGSTLNEVVVYLQKFLEQTEPDQKLSIVSGHDATILSLAYLLEINTQIPATLDFASTITIEIFENTALKGDYELKFLFFKNFADSNPIVLEIPGCSAPCSIRKFIESVQLRIVDDYDRVCNNYEENMSTTPSDQIII